MPLLILLLLIIQLDPVLKTSSEFEIRTNYQLKRKPLQESSKVIVDKIDERRSSSTDLLPFLSINLKVKKWHDDVTHVKIIDEKTRTILRKRTTDEGIYNFDIGFVDDIKDKITKGKFYIFFQADKKTVEQINLSIEEDGTFLVNGEKRGKF